MRVFAFVAILIGLLGIPAAFAQEPILNDPGMPETTSTGPKPSRGWFFAKILGSGAQDPVFNAGQNLYFYVKSQPTAGRWTYAATMGRDRVIAIAGATRITSLGVRRDGSHAPSYSGIETLEIQGALGNQTAGDIALGPFIPNSHHESFTVGNGGVRIDADTVENAITVVRRSGAGSDGVDHFFGEDGLAVIFRSQVDPGLDRLTAMRVLADQSGAVRIVAIGEKNDGGNKTFSAWIIALTPRGTLDPAFGRGGMLEVDAPVAAPYQTLVHKRAYDGDPQTAIREVFLGRIARVAGRDHIQIAAFDVFDGTPLPGFTPIDLRLDYGYADSARIETSESRIAIVANMPGDDQTPHRRMIAVAKRDGTPDPDFSGDGKRVVPVVADDLILLDIALTNDDRLYMVEMFKGPSNEFLAISRWNLGLDGQGARDMAYGIDGTVQLNAGNTRSSHGEPLNGYRMTFHAKEAFIEPLANGAHALVIAGSASVEP